MRDKLNSYRKLAGMIAIVSICLTGCTMAGSGSSQAGSGAASGTQNGASTVQNLSGLGTGNTASGSASQNAASSQSGSSAGQSSASGTSSGSGGASAPGTSQKTDYDISSQTGGDTPQQQQQLSGTTTAGSVTGQSQKDDSQSESGDYSLDDQGAGASNDKLPDSAVFEGQYAKEDKSETVTLIAQGDNTVSFEFAQSGIYGTAKMSGMTEAQYDGDDGYKIIFAKSGTTVTVTVSGDDADASSLNGTYWQTTQ